MMTTLASPIRSAPPPEPLPDSDETRTEDWYLRMIPASPYATFVLVGLMAATILGLLGLFVDGLSHKCLIPVL